jgi:hypothetical protein
MDGIEKVVHERNDSFLRLETGDSASPPMRRITSFMGFTYDEPAREHYEPFDKPAAEKTANKKEYEVPYLDDEAYLMQKLWAEKQQMRSQIELHDKYLAIEQKQATTPLRLRRPLRKSFNMVDHLPEVVVKRKLGIGDSTDKNDELFEQQV